MFLITSNQKQLARAKKAQPDQKKRNLMKIGITTTINHVFQAMPFTDKQIDKLEKERNKAFWSREENAIQNKEGLKCQSIEFAGQ